MLGDLGPNQSKGLDQYLPLFNANNARRRAEQDSILLANRIRLLRTEEEKARKKIRDTECKTKEIIDLRRRGEEKRVAREAESSRREAFEQELRARAAGVREEQQRKVERAQREVLEEKVQLSAALKQEREVHKQQIQRVQEEVAAETAAKADRVRRQLAASERRRARSEGARLEVGRANFQEKLAREEDARRANQMLISGMEKEEAELIQRLQRSQERHRRAFAQLEDALAGGSSSPSHAATASSSRCPSSLDQVPLAELPQVSAPSAGSRMPLAASSVASTSAEAREPRAVAARPPRPRVAITATPHSDAMVEAAGTAGGARPTSAPRANSVPRGSASATNKLHGRCSKNATGLRDNSATSICSTASGGPGPESAASGPASGHSTPSSATPAPITYTTVDGLQLDIPPEEDLDLDKLLSGH